MQDTQLEDPSIYYNNAPRNNNRMPRNGNGDDKIGNLLDENSGLGLEDKSLLSSLIQDPKNRTPLDLIQVITLHLSYVLFLLLI